MPTATSQKLALEWLGRHVHPDGGIVVSEANRSQYPEVTGYTIPTMIACGERDTALRMARWLLRNQESDGGFLGADGRPHVFDTAQILRGFLAVRRFIPDVDRAIRKACDWLLSELDPEEHVWRAPTSPAWYRVPEAIFLYAIRPFIDGMRLSGTDSKVGEVQQVLERFYLRRLRVKTNSHFRGYIAAGLLELGYQRAAQRVARMPSDHTWTGTAQLADTWCKLGRYDHGAKLLGQMASHQSVSGGWVGGLSSYFAKDEVSWAVKFYLDACTTMRQSWFETHGRTVPDRVDGDDDRLRSIIEILDGMSDGRVLDAGCGRGRYLRHLVGRLPHVEFHGCDMTGSLLADVPRSVHPMQGSLTDLPYSDRYFDATICVEALEHAVFVQQALGELKRVTKPGGVIIIIDKDRKHWGELPVPPWEQWFDEDLLGKCTRLSMSGGLFLRWVYDVPTGSGSRHD